MNNIIIPTEQVFTRKCPNCSKDIFYKHKSSLNRAIKYNQKCKICSDISSKSEISQEIIEKILHFNSLGTANVQIQNDLKLSYWVVENILRRFNQPSILRNKTIELISENEARCSRCGKVKSLNEFQFGRKNQEHEYKFSYCNECRNKQIIKNFNSDVDKFLSDRFNKLKRKAKINNISFSLSKEEFIQQYHNQNGLCFYTDEPMKCEFGTLLKRDSLSTDRVIPNVGYVKGNIVFCLHKINTCKSDLSLEEIKKWMPAWFERIKYMRNLIVQPFLDDLKEHVKYCIRQIWKYRTDPNDLNGLFNNIKSIADIDYYHNNDYNAPLDPELVNKYQYYEENVFKNQGCQDDIDKAFEEAKEELIQQNEKIRLCIKEHNISKKD